ncbi:MAG: GLPGLI family protein [Flavobacteriaceae bacterium]|nr:GLPGLI family protein [Flavobacteriaceae bacterium]
MKIIIYILICFFCINIFSQIEGGHATYKIKFETSHIINNSEIINNGLKIFKSFNEPAKNMEFDLFFNKKESIFNIKNKVNVSHDVPAYNFAMVMSRGKGKFYCSSKERLRQKEGFGDIFIVKYDYIKKSDWILKNETKIIKGYLCYKAIINNTEFNNLVAWY